MSLIILEKIRSFFEKKETVTQLNADGMTYLINPQGHHVPLNLIKPVDLARHNFVLDRVKEAKVVSDVIKSYKVDTNALIEAFLDYSANQHGVTRRKGKNKGNVTFMSFCGKYRMRLAMAESVSFDEGLQAAKQLIDELIAENSDGVNEVIMAMVNQSFKVDKKGFIDTKRVLALRENEINHPKWQKAMDIIAESIKREFSKSYIQLYERLSTDDKQPDGKWRLISLDMANV